jgi:hypothetical protein
MVNPTPSVPAITINPNQAEFCAGEAYSLTASSITPDVTFQWNGETLDATATTAGLTTQERIPIQ